ncbi:hypothetical protein ABT234_16525 [Streptomyces sp. NPDC001586]|uniref:hypothetical protein n=1 Tax=Streptomyces sp. NPDC001586 TaxID=3154387 RepID=UPI00331AD879
MRAAATILSSAESLVPTASRTKPNSTQSTGDSSATDSPPRVRTFPARTAAVFQGLGRSKDDA